MSSSLVGRFLDGLAAEPGALLVEGEAGVGKTTVWVAAIGQAESRGIRVLQARAAETEVQLSYAALVDLVGAEFEAARRALPPIQQRALAAALLRAEATSSFSRARSRRRSRGSSRRLPRPPWFSWRSTTCSGSTPRRPGRSRSPPGGCRTGSACSSPGAAIRSTSAARPRAGAARGSAGAAGAATALPRGAPPSARRPARLCAVTPGARPARRGLGRESVPGTRDRPRARRRLELVGRRGAAASAARPAGPRERARGQALGARPRGEPGCCGAVPTHARLDPAGRCRRGRLRGGTARRGGGRRPDDGGRPRALHPPAARFRDLRRREPGAPPSPARATL